MKNTLNLSLTQIQLFADVGGDPNPIHQNEEAAKAMGLEGPIAHGMFVYCYLLEQLDKWIAQEEKQSGTKWRLKTTKCRFHEPALIGKTFHSTVEVGEMKDNALRATLTFSSEDGRRLTQIAAQLQRV